MMINALNAASTIPEQSPAAQQPAQRVEPGAQRPVVVLLGHPGVQRAVGLQVGAAARAPLDAAGQIGRASCRERV